MFKYYSNRVENIYVDSGSRESIIRNVYNKKISFKIIIEDASHMLKDQILSLFILFKAVDPGGIFIIEEIDFPEKTPDCETTQNPRKNSCREQSRKNAVKIFAAEMPSRIALTPRVH